MDITESASYTVCKKLRALNSRNGNSYYSGSIEDDRLVDCAVLHFGSNLKTGNSSCHELQNLESPVSKRLSLSKNLHNDNSTFSCISKFSGESEVPFILRQYQEKKSPFQPISTQNSFELFRNRCITERISNHNETKNEKNGKNEKNEENENNENNEKNAKNEINAKNEKNIENNKNNSLKSVWFKKWYQITVKTNIIHEKYLVEALRRRVNNLKKKVFRIIYQHSKKNRIDNNQICTVFLLKKILKIWKINIYNKNHLKSINRLSNYECNFAYILHVFYSWTCWTEQKAKIKLGYGEEYLKNTYFLTESFKKQFKRRFKNDLSVIHKTNKDSYLDINNNKLRNSQIPNFLSLWIHLKASAQVSKRLCKVLRYSDYVKRRRRFIIISIFTSWKKYKLNSHRDVSLKIQILCSFLQNMFKDLVKFSWNLLKRQINYKINKMKKNELALYHQRNAKLVACLSFGRIAQQHFSLTIEQWVGQLSRDELWKSAYNQCISCLSVFHYFKEDTKGFENIITLVFKRHQLLIAIMRLKRHALKRAMTITTGPWILSRWRCTLLVPSMKNCPTYKLCSNRFPRVLNRLRSIRIKTRNDIKNFLQPLLADFLFLYIQFHCAKYARLSTCQQDDLTTINNTLLDSFSGKKRVDSFSGKKRVDSFSGQSSPSTVEKKTIKKKNSNVQDDNNVFQALQPIHKTSEFVRTIGKINTDQKEKEKIAVITMDNFFPISPQKKKQSCDDFFSNNSE